jgi:hypothetical protein
MKSWQEQHDLVAAAIKTFPAEFGLRAFYGDRFRLSQSSSYVNDSDVVMLYTERWNERLQSWQSFAKGTAQELRRELCSLAVAR